MARRLMGLFLKPAKFHRLPLPILSTSDKHLACFSTTQNIFSSEVGQATGIEVSKITNAEDRLRKFIDPNVQQLLKELTEINYDRVFRQRKIGQKLKYPKYAFMTEDQLVQAAVKAQHTAEKLLQMPPVLAPRKPLGKHISWDPEIQGYDPKNLTLLCVDISPNRTDRNRIMVAREADGLLRFAHWEERDKLNRIYFPSPARTVKAPRMYTNPELLAEVLKRVEKDPNDNVYEYICDRACIQFEPDDPLYISAVEAVYDAIDRLEHYDYLRYTRHYGPMVFHYVRHSRMDKLLSFYIKRDRISQASKLVSLFHHLFPDCKSIKEQATNDMEKISKYVQLDAVQKSVGSLWNSYLEQERAKSDLEKGLQIAHGVQ